MPARKRGDVWYARFQIGGQPIERAAGPRKADAIALEAKIRREHVDQKLGRPPARLIDDALLRWLDGEARALESYQDILAKVEHIRSYTAGRSIEEATDVAEAIKAEGLAAGLSPITINRRLAALRRVCRLAWKWGWVKAPPPVTLLPGEKARRVALTETQFEALVLACEGRIADAVILGAYTGLREGELLALGPEHVTDVGIAIEKKTRMRQIPLADRVKPIVARLPLGLTYPQLRAGFEAARRRAGMPWLQFRDLRRTFGSWIVQRTGSLKAAQDLLGHTTPTITAKHYAHLLDDHLVAAISTALDRPRTGQKLGKKRGAADTGKPKKAA